MATVNSFIRSIATESRKAQRASIRAQKQQERESIRAQKEATRAFIADKKEQKRMYLESQLEKTEELNSKIQEQIEDLADLLAQSIQNKYEFTLEDLKKKARIPKFSPPKFLQKNEKPQKSDYLPKRNFWHSLIPALQTSLERKTKEKEKEFELDLIDFQKKKAHWEKEVDKNRIAYEAEVKRITDEVELHNNMIDTVNQDLSNNVPQAIWKYFEFAFQSVEQPEEFPLEIKIAYAEESRQLVIEYDLPTIDIIPETISYKYNKSSDVIIPIPAKESWRNNFYSSVIAQDVLRVVNMIFQLDKYEQVDSLVLNAYVQAIDKRIGKPVRPCLVTLRVNKDTFKDIDLSQVDPISCLQGLNASFSQSPAELSPVKPVLEFNMVDRRFIQETDVLSGLDQRPNLMDLTPGEFESLITNLFSKMGLETRLTQASRDGGVDCVAYDPRPIFGGKIVIQAKRYKHTVGVAAVRDLYGTMQNEGATKGILVTTSGYGKAAFDFADGKPLELLSGTHLLYLLEEIANIKAKIVR